MCARRRWEAHGMANFGPSWVVGIGRWGDGSRPSVAGVAQQVAFVEQDDFPSACCETLPISVNTFSMRPSAFSLLESAVAGIFMDEIFVMRRHRF